MGGLNTIGHAISNDKVNLDAGCKSLLGCTPVAAFIAKNCIPEFHDMALDKIQEFIVYKKAKSEMTPEELAEIQKSNIPPVEISCHPVEDLPDKLNEKNVESKSINEGTIYYDVLFDIGLPCGKANRVIVDIEAQNKYNPGYHMLNRGSFYCGRMVSAITSSHPSQRASRRWKRGSMSRNGKACRNPLPTGWLTSSSQNGILAVGPVLVMLLTM